jgi:hypothetical protein
VRAVLTDASNAPIAGQVVRLLALPAGGARQTVGSTRTTSTGAVSFSVLPRWSTRYTAVYDGNATHAPSTTTFDVRVLPRVSAHPLATTVRRGALLTVDATTIGMPPRQRAVLQLRRRDGSWVNVALGYLGSTGAVRLSWRPAVRADDVLRVVVPMANGIPGAASLAVAVRVT